MSADNPILNNPYEEPLYHYSTAKDGSLNYADKRKGRRVFSEDVQVIPIKQGNQLEAFEVNDFAPNFDNHLVNILRKEVGKWRLELYPNTTRITKTLLDFWFNNPERLNEQKLFFAQREAIETAIWLNEVADKSNAGNNVLTRLKEFQYISSTEENNLPRLAFKMATGSGKTVVMAGEYHETDPPFIIEADPGLIIEIDPPLIM